MTSFYLTLSQHLVDGDFFEQILQLGFLAQFTSLLSCNGMHSLYRKPSCTLIYLFCKLTGSYVVQATAHKSFIHCLGDENGMLEDMTVIVQELRSVSFQVCAF